MSFFASNGHKMMHAAVNTDPLQITVQENRQSYYRLKERNIPHIKIADVNELKMWYDFGQKIGQGGFGVVLEIVEKSTKKNWAIKSVPKTTSDEYRLKMVQREIQILKLIQHPHIIFLDKIYETSKKMYLIFERCYGELTKLYNERKPFVDKTARNIMKQLTEAITYLHKYDIVHRDVKMENILMGENPHDPTDEYYIKLTDFGLSIVKHSKGIEGMLHDYCGTIFYMGSVVYSNSTSNVVCNEYTIIFLGNWSISEELEKLKGRSQYFLLQVHYIIIDQVLHPTAPEILTLRSYSQQCDVWAIGVILYMLVTGKYPFFSNNERELQRLICLSDPDFSNIKLSVEVTDLILLLLTKDPANRLTAAEALHHPWMLNKKLSKAIEHNILKMMKDWKSEMQLPAGKESDWVLQRHDNSLPAVKPGKTPMNLPKTNISFDRTKKAGNTSKQTLNSARTSRLEQSVSPTRKHGGPVDQI